MHIWLDEDPGKFNIFAFLFLSNELKSYIQIPFGILSVNINVLVLQLHNNFVYLELRENFVMNFVFVHFYSQLLADF